ncbi:hypothetical protein ACHAPT_013570 [Fusarium lateritium]
MVAILLVGEFISNADGTMMLAADARIMSGFGELQNVDWLTTSYSLGVCAAQPLYGKLSDVYGRRAMLLASYLFFSLGCIISGFGLAAWQVVGGRVVSGVGGAGLMTMASIIVTVILMTLILAPEQGREGSAGGNGREGKVQRIDWAGSSLLSGFIIFSILLLHQNTQFITPVPAAFLALALSCLAGFFVVERYVAPEPIFCPTLLRQPNVLLSYLVSSLQIVAQSSMMFGVPLYFQITERASAKEAGAHLVPAVIGNAAGGLLAGFIIKKTGRFKIATSISGLFALCSYATLLLFWNGATSSWESLYIFPSGFGTGMLQAGIFVSMASSLDASQIAVATGGYFLFMNIGSTASVTIANALLVSTFRKGLLQRITGPDKLTIIERALSDKRYVNELSGKLRQVVIECYVHGLKFTWRPLMVIAIGNPVTSPVTGTIHYATNQYLNPFIGGKRETSRVDLARVSNTASSVMVSADTFVAAANQLSLVNSRTRPGADAQNPSSGGFNLGFRKNG